MFVVLLEHFTILTNGHPESEAFLSDKRWRKWATLNLMEFASPRQLPCGKPRHLKANPGPTASPGTCRQTQGPAANPGTRRSTQAPEGKPRHPKANPGPRSKPRHPEASCCELISCSTGGTTVPLSPYKSANFLTAFHYI